MCVMLQLELETKIFVTSPFKTQQIFPWRVQWWVPKASLATITLYSAGVFCACEKVIYHINNWVGMKNIQTYC